MSGTSGPGHDLTAPCALDLCVTEYGICPVLGRSENQLRDEEEEEEKIEEEEEEEEEREFTTFAFNMALGAVPVCNIEGRGKIQKQGKDITRQNTK